MGFSLTGKLGHSSILNPNTIPDSFIELAEGTNEFPAISTINTFVGSLFSLVLT